jgi:hypothetical protein
MRHVLESVAVLQHVLSILLHEVGSDTRLQKALWDGHTIR